MPGRIQALETFMPVGVAAAQPTSGPPAYLAAGDDSGTLRVVDLLDLAPGSNLYEEAIGAPIWCLCSALVDNESIVVAGDRAGRLHAVRTLIWARAEVQAHDGGVDAATSGTLGGSAVVITAGRVPGAGATIQVWHAPSPDVATWVRGTHIDHAFGGGVAGLSLLSLNGRAVILATGDPLDDPEELGGMVRMFDPLTGDRVGHLSAERTGVIDALPTSGPALITRQFESATQDRVSRWDLDTHEQQASAHINSGRSMHLASVQAVGVPALAAPTNDGIELRDPNTLDPLSGWRPIAAPEVIALCSAELSDQTLLVSGGADGAIRVWDLSSPNVTAGTGARPRGARQVACGMRGPGPAALVAGVEAAYVCDLVRGTGRQTLWQVPMLTGATAFTSWGHILAADSSRNVVVSKLDEPGFSVWLTGHTAPVTAIATWERDGLLLAATTSLDRTTRVWDTATGLALTPGLSDTSDGTR